MPTRRTIWSTDNTCQFIATHRAADDEERSISGVLNDTIERYQAIVHHHMPDLSLGEWCALFDCANGTFFDDATTRYLWAEIADAPELGHKWRIDVAALSARLRSMPYASLVAIVDATERFWASDTEGGSTEGWRPMIAAIVGDEHIV